MRTDRISAGSFDLNKWLYGGYEKDIITTIYGPAGSGKTNFCVLAASSMAKKDKKVIFIDSEGGFSLDRFKQVTGEEYEKALKNILLLKPVTFDEQEKAFEKMLKEIKGVGLIVVDGMTMLYRLELANCKEDEMKVKEINSQLARQLRTLAEISRNKLIPIIATNQTYSEFLSDEDFRAGKKPEARMVGGDLLKYWSKCIIELKQEGKNRKAILKKHRSMAEKELNFYITGSGIKKRRWI
ncbi:MAG: DNA repair and recombination protein RadB [archaeon]